MIFLNRIGDRMKKKNIYIIIVLVVVLALLGSSYAYLRAERGSENSQKITLANLDVILLNDMTNVSMDLLPMTDANGLNNTPTTFKIKNNGSIMASYRVSLIDGTTASTMSNSDVRYRLKRTVGSNAQEILDIRNLDSEGLIDSGTIEAGETISYELVCWVDYNANPNGLTFSKKILVEGMQVESLDQSGANYPELLDNMLAVYYEKTSDTAGTWKVADSANKNSSYKWFDYDDLMWANAVTIKKDSVDKYRLSYGNEKTTSNVEMTISSSSSPEVKQMVSSTYTYNSSTGVFTLGADASGVVLSDTYLDYYTCNSSSATSCYKLYQIKELDGTNTTKVDLHEGSDKGKFGVMHGQTVSMDDITSMWVWIPRYKYTIFNGNKETANEQMIKIEFEYGVGKTGTVTCSDNITNTSSSSSSQTCSNIVNGSSTYTHPAFTFGDEELTGFWIGKFESSTDNSTCLGSITSANCNKTGFNIVIKPGVKSLRYINIYNMFANTRNMEVYDNIHGFNQNENATTWLNSSNVLTGEIANDNNNFDIHMIKNMEWGAVAYLSHSKYGKYGNDLYTGLYKEIYVNNYNTYTTGYSGGSYNSSSSATATYPYNDLTDQGSGKGYKGAGASSTGNIYGVYDLSGGVGEYAMGNIVNSSTAFNVGSATTWTTTNYPLSKYYDRYSYNSSSTNYNSTSVGRGKLGDATREVVKSWGSTGKWYSDYNYFPYGTSNTWFSRGGYMSETTSAGVFASSNTITGTYSQYYGSRAILTVSRDLPWLSD